jgi:hypothetical protein
MPRFTSSWRVFGAESAFFDIFAIFSEANSHYSEFGGVFGEKRRRVSYWISGATGNHSSRNFGRFWVFSAFWSQWSRLQSQQRCRSAIFRAEELEEPSGPWVKRSFIGAAFTVLGDFRVISSFCLYSEFVSSAGLASLLAFFSL